MKGELSYFEAFEIAFPETESALCESCCGSMNEGDDGMAAEAKDTDGQWIALFYHFPCWQKLSSEKELSRALDGQGAQRTIVHRPPARPIVPRRRVPNRVRELRRQRQP